MARRKKEVQTDDFGQFSFFEETVQEENSVPQEETLDVVKAEFIQAERLNWIDLFDGYDELYAITYSSGIDFVEQVASRFEKAEVILGYESVMSADAARLAALSVEMIRQIAQRPATLKLANRIEDGSFKLYISRAVKSHEKIYILKSHKEKYRVITGSANFSYSAFNGVQRENISYMEGEAAYLHYKKYYEDFRTICADHIEPAQITAGIKLEDEIANLDEIPLFNGLKNNTVVVIDQEPEDPEEVIVASAKALEGTYRTQLPRKDSEGRVSLRPDRAVTISAEIKKIKADHRTKKTEREKLPHLHIGYETNTVSFNDREFDLNPDPDLIRNDLECLFRYMEGFDAFTGDTRQTKLNYYFFLNWCLSSPFFAFLRIEAHRCNFDINSFPMFAILYGNSNGGKTSFAKLVSKMMCGRSMNVNATDEFTAGNVYGLRTECEGLPLIFDDLNRDQYRNHASKIIKNDNFGITGPELINCPAVVITTNELPSVTADLSKRMYLCHIDSCIDKDKSRTLFRPVNNSIRQMTNAFYCEYLRRMLPVVNDLINQMRAGAEDCVPDIIRESSEMIVTIAKELVDDVPEYVCSCSYDDLMGDKAIGKNAIKKIRQAWASDNRSFSVSKKENTVRYQPEGGKEIYWQLKAITDEIPFSLNANIHGNTLTMDLDEACRFFQIDFTKRRFRDRLRK